MKKSGFFWVGFADLMTSLFFIMLILYVVSFALYKKQIGKIDIITGALEKTIKELKLSVSDLEKTKGLLIIQAEKAKIIDDVEKNLEPLIKNSSLFKYEEKYKRFTLAFNVNFNIGKYKIDRRSLKNHKGTIKNISDVGKELQNVINVLEKEKIKNPSMKNVSYLVIIAGYSSRLINENMYAEYQRSYKRAYHLWEYWKHIGIDFEAKKYKGLIDLQISGNGWGGIGRFKRDPNNGLKNESNNQRFIIQIVPKIGKSY